MSSFTTCDVSGLYMAGCPHKLGQNLYTILEILN